MTLIFAFLRLIRSLNLLFIAITQFLFQYFIINRIFQSAGMPPVLSTGNFILLVSSSLSIAAAGYIINDYFDLNIDRINRPDKLVVEKMIKRRWAIIWHWVLSLAGVVLGLWVAFRIHNIWLAFANAGCVIALWFYSTTFKKKLLSGNILISLLTSWVVLVIGFITHYRLVRSPAGYEAIDASKILRLSFLYAGFAFIISLIREVVKDMEDMRGDEKYGCRTMPIVWGVNVSKVFAGTWLVVLIAALIIVQAYVLQFHWWGSAIYCFTLVILPLLYILKNLYTAQSANDFHQLSKWIKLVMFTGILSMLFFRI